MPDTCPEKRAKGRTLHLAAEKGGGHAWGGRDDKGRWEVARGMATLSCVCCQRRAGNHCHHSKPHLGLPTQRRGGQPVSSCSGTRWFLWNKHAFWGCLAAEAKRVTQNTSWVTLLLGREWKKGEEIHKAIVHVWLSGRLRLSSIFSVSLP